MADSSQGWQTGQRSAPLAVTAYPEVALICPSL